MTLEQLKVWIGRFPSQEQAEAYFHETYPEDGDAPISPFAAGQDETFYDHDFLEVNHLPEPVTDIRAPLEGHSFSTSYIDAVVQAFEADALPVNALVLFFGEELESPRSVSGPDFELRYLGAFSYDPQAESVASAKMGVVPASILLQLQSPGAALYAGDPVREVRIDSRGLIVGRGGAAGDRPYLDLAPLPGCEAVAQVQVQIYQDEWENWMVEDQAGNGLTVVGGAALDRERGAPWHGMSIQFGAAEFNWNCFPEAGGA